MGTGSASETCSKYSFPKVVVGASLDGRGVALGVAVAVAGLDRIILELSGSLVAGWVEGSKSPRSSPVLPVQQNLTLGRGD